jgi:GST-like protein
MLDLYTAATTNGQRASLAVLESGLPYRRHHVDLNRGEHRSPAYLALNPNGAVPAMVDDDGPDGRPLVFTQSVEIAWYVLEKAGRLIPGNPHDRVMARQWSAFVATDLYPPFAAMYFMTWAKPGPLTAAAAIFEETMMRRFGLLDDYLAQSRHMAGEDYGVADVVAYPMTVLAARDFPKVGNLKHLARWQAEVARRPAVAEAMGWFAGSGPLLERAPGVTQG